MVSDASNNTLLFLSEILYTTPKNHHFKPLINLLLPPHAPPTPQKLATISRLKKSGREVVKHPTPTR